MAAQDVEVIKLAGSCEPRACGPTQPTFPDSFPGDAEESAEVAQQMTPQEKDEARVLKRRIG